jgi:phosphonate transport system ATP-binding protein
MDALLRINKHFGITVICNLHSMELTRGYCDRVIGMSAGRLVFEGTPQMLTDAVARELFELDALSPSPIPAQAPMPGLVGVAAA